MVVKLNLSNAYDRINWLFLRFILIHTRFGLPFINWIEGCLASSSFSNLINGYAYMFFKPERGL
jgi:hypothetical protein